MSKEQISQDSRSPLSLFLIGLTGIYISLLLIAPATILPGEPVWAIQTTTIQDIVDESINFFFVLPLINWVGIHVMEAPPVHPLMQAFFNFAEAWIFMFLPLLLLDPRRGKLPSLLIWVLAMFLTNIFLMPYMAARLQQSPVSVPSSKDTIAKVFGVIGLLVGMLAILWPVLLQANGGSLSEQWLFFQNQVTSSRVTLAFCIDLGLFYIFQIWLMGAIAPEEPLCQKLKAIPFWGLAIWLLL